MKLLRGEGFRKQHLWHVSEQAFDCWQVDKWNDCPSKPGCIIVNIGDTLQYWSDGLFKSNFHRVRLPREGEPLVCHFLLDIPPDLHQCYHCLTRHSHHCMKSHAKRLLISTSLVKGIPASCDA